MYQDMLQFPNKGSQEEECEDVNNTGFEKTGKLALQMLYVGGKAVDTQCILVSNTECKQNFSLVTRNLHRKPLGTLYCFSTAGTFPDNQKPFGELRD